MKLGVPTFTVGTVLLTPRTGHPYNDERRFPVTPLSTPRKTEPPTV